MDRASRTACKACPGLALRAITHWHMRTREPVMTRPIQAGPSSPAQPMMRAPTCTS